MTGPARAQLPRTVFVTLFALVLTVALVVRVLSAFDWDATVFVGFGAETPTREYAEERLGEVQLRGALGHDGKYFFVQANDPWLSDPENNAEILDFPVYRSQRMLYPLLAGGFGLFGPRTTVWGLLIVNVAAVAFGTLGAARLARTLGGSPWWGLAFPGNLGLIFGLTIDAADILAAAFAIWAIALLYEDRFAPAVGVLAAAALTREVMIVVAVGAAVWLWTAGRRRHALYAIGVPALALGIWDVYLRMRLGPDQPGVNAIGWPFVGLARAIPDWWGDPTVLAAGVSVIAFTLMYVFRWWKVRSLLGWAFLGFVPLAVTMTAKVWGPIFDFTRALAPLLTATILLVFVERQESRLRGQPELTTEGAGR